ncbi:MAG TPA: mechanosensitive ion channel family protein [Bryobacteraceae bacterium]|jgi:small-conductance mechanosensitive channel
MDPVSRFFAHHYVNLLISLAIVAVTFGVGWLVRKILFRLIHRWKGGDTHLEVLLVDSLRTPLMIWFLMLGLDLAIRFSEVPTRIADRIEIALAVLWIISLTVMASGFAGNMVRFYGRRFAGDLPVTSLSQNLVQIFVVVLGGVTLLHYLNVQIAPILTALGVGGLAVALALQDTLSNLFGGFYVSVAGQIRLGDYIRLNSGEEGYISDISWRSTTIRGLGNNLIMIPNATMAKAIITNFNLPEKRMSVSLTVGVDYSCDPDHVEAVLLEVAVKAAADVPGVLADPAPVVRFAPGFGDSALQFTLSCNVTEFSEQFRVQHELRKRILQRFRAENIDMPFPTRTVFLKQ